jgi:hypothetical protein
MRIAVAVACLLSVPVAGAPSANLQVRVSPKAAMEPAAVLIRATAERSPDNRLLEVAIQSPTYYRSSQVTVDGERAPRIFEFRYTGLPAGAYEISATLVSASGQRAVGVQSLQVVPFRDR